MTFMLRQNKITQPAFDQRLRAVYAETLREPIPRDMLDLLARRK